MCEQMQPQPSAVWVIGGAQIYAQALPLAHTVVVTEIDAAFAGDAFAPELGQSGANYSENPTSAPAAGLQFCHLFRALNPPAALCQARLPHQSLLNK